MPQAEALTLLGYLNMIDVLNTETATAYAHYAISTPIVITSVEATQEGGDPAIDVGFTFDGNRYTGCMTVWLESGQLYGEW
jgi:hypothetical protein